MTYGITTYRASGSVMVDYLTRGALLIDILTLPANGSGSQTYSRVPGGQLYYFVSKAANHNITVDTTALGEARINWTSPSYSPDGSSVLYVFARQVTTVDTYGIILKNDYGDTIADLSYPTPQFVQTIALNATAYANYTTPDGYTVYLHQTNSFNTRDSSDRIVLIAMPDAGAKDVWYSLRTECIPANTGYTTVIVAVYTKSATYDLPSVHIYAINNPAPSSDTYGMRIWDSSQNLKFDSGCETINTRDALTISYGAAGGAGNTYSLSISSLPGVSIPYYYNNVNNLSSATRWMGVAKRVGNQITFKQIKDAYSANSSVSSYEIGVRDGRYCPVVDLTGLGPAATLGTPGGVTLTVPAFTSHPGDTTVYAGSTATFTVSVTGNPTPALQWYFKGVAVGTNSTTYSRTVLSGDDGGQVYCVATNSLGNAQSNSATLWVGTPPPDPTPVSIISSPQSQTVAAGDSVTFNVGVTGTTPISYNWYKNGSFVSSNSGYTFVASSSDNGAQIYCRVTNNGGANSATSGTATLTVNNVLAPAPVFTMQPTNITTTVGATVTFTAAASNTTTYYWYRSGTGSYVGTGSTHTPDTSVQGTFTYFCRAYNGQDVYTDSTSATLTVNAASQATYPSYNNPPAYTATAQTNSGSWSIGGSTSDSGAWANGSGDSSLYDVMATNNGGVTSTSSSSYDQWYSLANGRTWTKINDTTSPMHLKFTWQVRLRSSGAIVASSTVDITILGNNV